MSKYVKNGDWKSAYVAMIRSLADYAWLAYMKNPWQTLYLAGSFDGKVWDDLVVNDDNGWGQLVISEPFPKSLTADGIAMWLRERLDSTPLAVVRDSY
jgi:hypothetical protein